MRCPPISTIAKTYRRLTRALLGLALAYWAPGCAFDGPLDEVENPRFFRVSANVIQGGTTSTYVDTTAVLHCTAWTGNCDYASKVLVFKAADDPADAGTDGSDGGRSGARRNNPSSSQCNCQSYALVSKELRFELPDPLAVAERAVGGSTIDGVASQGFLELTRVARVQFFATYYEDPAGVFDLEAAGKRYANGYFYSLPLE